MQLILTYLLTLSKLTFVKGGNSQRGFHFFHTQNRPGPLSVQEIPTLLAAKQKFRILIQIHIQ